MMARRVMIIAGEPSGDLHGSGVVRELKRQQPDVEVYGVGGDGMAGAGMELIFHIRDLSFMGFVEILKHLPTIRKVNAALESLLEHRRPDVLVLIDYPGFNLRFSKLAKRRGVKILYYISPQVWAWGKRRVKKMKRLIDKMFVVFPFETEIYQRVGIPVEFVGHPLLEVIAGGGRDVEFREKLGVRGDGKLLGLFPGSRMQEVERIFPVMLEAASVVRSTTGCEIGVGVAPTVPLSLYDGLLRSSIESASADSIHLVSGATYELMRNADLAFVTSGTATLETACFGTPMVVVYRTSFTTYWIGRLLITLKNIALVNIVAGRPVVPELIQRDLTPERLVAEARRILENHSVEARMRSELMQVREKLGTPGASRRVAEQVLRS
jgi:lipid-A-disaccharide synthase